ncbi:alanine/glycine:cation symporter family protein [Rothia terrae]|uniref:Alanine:cation symporter family protein n=1 Tax=Rothia terrae TaxID=396015 RepID=A0A7H2BDE9_9MICC|nr:alanine/glycine:cation symporter family protein [Rothia terrae]QNV37695.1 alanine:cation symporter family protein [Rothia terrae]
MDAILGAIEWLNSTTAGASDVILNITNTIWTYFLFAALIIVGLIITIWTRGIQFRGLGEMFRTLKDPAGTEQDGSKGISAFRAFTVSAASRVGTGNIAGVAIAITMGGPGAVFWMWVIASVGAASAFAESLLGQLYKERGKDSYIGGPAYYMKRGLNAKWLGLIFVAFIVVTYAFVFVAVQTNAIVDATSTSFGVDVTGTNGMGYRLLVGVIIMALTAAIIFGGIRTISSVTEWLVPVMAVLYVGLGLLVVILNIGAIPGMIVEIVQGAFGIREFGVGGLMGALLWGMKRGLLSNEAGMGTAPNAGATAVVSHPAKQGFVQSLGVYFDTILICSITAFVVLIYKPEYGVEAQGASLTQTALASELGGWAVHFLSIAITLFAFSSIIGNYYYGESNIRFVTESRVPMFIFRVIVLFFVFFGAIASLNLLWNTADLLNAGMVVVNLTAVMLLMPKVIKVLKNYEAQRKAGKEPVFHREDLPEANLAAWDGRDEIASNEFWETRALQIVEAKEAKQQARDSRRS